MNSPHLDTQSVVRGPVAAPKSLFKMQMIWPYPRPTESKILGAGPAICVLQGFCMLLVHPNAGEHHPDE